MADMHIYLDEAGLLDLTPRGCFYTCSNHQPWNPISRKLDIALVNDYWRETFPDSSAVFDAMGYSDHSPILIYFTQASTRRLSPFKFFTLFSNSSKLSQTDSGGLGEC
ncbi:hypothetical protein V5N11_005577 [Cardamine amara subsp. amara]|uniref:Endonuclease/exonuclease/phosphatase domain-containing protein n=1 Tax=Cardamine amara subsp. amara TaxID=228776 RepID=A0ABD1AJP0_CARAN